MCIFTSPMAVTQRIGVECAVDPAMIFVFNSSKDADSVPAMRPTYLRREEG